MIEILKFFYKQFYKLTHLTCIIKCKEIGRNVTIGDYVTLGYGSFIFAKKIGDYTYINNYTYVDKNVSSIGKYCSIANDCRIGLGGHPMDWVTTHAITYNKRYKMVSGAKKDYDFNSNYNTVIGNDVWIGANATILAGVTVGDGAIIGAHSLVTEDVAPYSIVVGTPAKHLKYRHSEDKIEKLMKIKWWNLSPSIIKTKIHLMDNVDEFIKDFD